MRYFVYIDGLVGVETNTKQFKWSFGSTAPETTYENYEKCKIKVRLMLCGDKDVFEGKEIESAKGCFRHFRGNQNENTLYYKQCLLKICKLNYYLKIDDNFIDVRVGKTYYELIKYKIMNIHPIWYIVFDIVTGMLLLKGYLPIYSSVVSKENSEAIVIFGPPNMGKTFTALKLCEEKKLSLISEDIAITDGENVYSVPWTNSYREYGNTINNRTVKKAICGKSVKYAFVLERGKKKILSNAEDIARKGLLLNHYLVCYANSPIVIAMSYFNDNFSVEKMIETEKKIFIQMLSGAQSACLIEESAEQYCDTICEIIN